MAVEVSGYGQGRSSNGLRDGFGDTGPKSPLNETETTTFAMPAATLAPQAVESSTWPRKETSIPSNPINITIPEAPTTTGRTGTNGTEASLQTTKLFDGEAEKLREDALKRQAAKNLSGLRGPGSYPTSTAQPDGPTPKALRGRKDTDRSVTTAQTIELLGQTQDQTTSIEQGFSLGRIATGVVGGIRNFKTGIANSSITRGTYNAKDAANKQARAEQRALTPGISLTPIKLGQEYSDVPELPELVKVDVPKQVDTLLDQIVPPWSDLKRHRYVPLEIVFDTARDTATAVQLLLHSSNPKLCAPVVPKDDKDKVSTAILVPIDPGQLPENVMTVIDTVRAALIQPETVNLTRGQRVARKVGIKTTESSAKVDQIKARESWDPVAITRDTQNFAAEVIVSNLFASPTAAAGVDSMRTRIGLTHRSHVRPFEDNDGNPIFVASEEAVQIIGETERVAKDTHRETSTGKPYEYESHPVRLAEQVQTPPNNTINTFMIPGVAGDAWVVRTHPLLVEIRSETRTGSLIEVEAAHVTLRGYNRALGKDAGDKQLAIGTINPNTGQGAQAFQGLLKDAMDKWEGDHVTTNIQEILGISPSHIPRSVRPLPTVIRLGEVGTGNDD